MDDIYMRKALYRVKECEVEHPKLELARKTVSKELEGNPDSRAIVFTNYRDTAEIVANALSGVPGIVPIRFVGQTSRHKDKGLTQKQQVEILDKFRAGEYNVLVATSVAEEGLDIPSTDLVLFYEPIPSEIRSIQRKGRTGRQHKGRVVVLVTKGTRDEAYYWSSKNKEKRMLNSMQGLEALLGPKDSKQDLRLSDFRSEAFILDNIENQIGNENKSGNGSENQDLIPEVGDLTVNRGDKTADGRDKHADNRDRVVVSDRVNDEIKKDNCRNGEEERKENRSGNESEKGKEQKDEGKNREEKVKERQKTLVYFETLSGKKPESKSELSAEIPGIETRPESLKIVMDFREAKSGVANVLDKLGVEVFFATLEIGDYVVSDRLAVERKRTDDFASSLIDGKRNLFAQLSDLARVYEKPVLIIEGTELFTSRQINPNAIYGSLISIGIDFGVSLLYSRDEEETAAILKVLAKREQIENKREVNPHGRKLISTLTEQQEYLISSIADIGPKAARNLLLHFGSVEAVMKADAKELKEVKLIGPKRAAKIRDILEAPYKEDK
jgi:Fanconi anemia group M protein